jgi:hypothetical protein
MRGMAKLDAFVEAPAGPKSRFPAETYGNTAKRANPWHKTALAGRTPGSSPSRTCGNAAKTANPWRKTALAGRTPGSSRSQTHGNAAKMAKLLLLVVPQAARHHERAAMQALQVNLPALQVNRLAGSHLQ